MKVNVFCRRRRIYVMKYELCYKRRICVAKGNIFAIDGKSVPQVASLFTMKGDFVPLKKCVPYKVDMSHRRLLGTVKGEFVSCRMNLCRRMRICVVEGEFVPRKWMCA